MSEEKPYPTRDQVLAARTPRGGWTKAQLAEWGVPWPPKRGWIDAVTHTILPTQPSPERPSRMTQEIEGEMPNGTTTKWLGHTRVAIESVTDRFNPMSGWLSKTQLGLRSDGVLVWRFVDDNDQPVEEESPRT